MRFLRFFIVFLIFVSVFSINTFAYGETADGIVSDSSSFDDIRYVPALPVDYSDYGYNFYISDTSDNSVYLCLSNSPVKYLSYYNSLMDSNFYEHSNYSRFRVYKYVYGTTPLKWEDSSLSGFFGGIQLNTSMRLLYSNYQINTIEGNSVFWSGNNDGRSIDYFLITIACGKIQRSVLDNLNVILPVGICILSSFVVLRVIRKFFLKNNYRKKMRKVRRFKPKWSKRHFH